MTGKSSPLLLALIVVLAALFGRWPETPAAASNPAHWTRCTLYWDGHGGFQRKVCHFYLLTRVTARPTGHWARWTWPIPGRVQLRVRYPTFAPPVGPGCFGAVDAASYRTGIAAATLRGVIRVESGGNPSAVSPAGAIGCTQLEPGTAAFVGVNPWDPAQNVLGGARYLAWLLRTAAGGDLFVALEMYNAGPGDPSAGAAYARRVEQESV